MDDLDIPRSKLAPSAENIINRASEEAKRREHALLTNEHICAAFIRVEWDLFTETMRSVGLNPQEIILALDDKLKRIPAAPGREIRTAPSTKLLLKLALLSATRSGRNIVEGTDLFAAIFEETQGSMVSIVRRHGVEPEVIILRLATYIREREKLEERLRKRFELPSFLKNFATNLNHLARQDKIPPVFGRENEILQVAEILCHRERANSVILIGEPGVGKTAIAEGLARAIEYTPDQLPLRIRECQVINLQMNTMVAGTMLRGMFEDRIQNVIREIKERPNLLLFIDEVHTMIGAGSAIGAPSDAANIFKSVLARGEVRIIGATTLNEYKEYIQEDEALSRRFRPVFVEEPSIAETKRILYQLRSRLERNYSVRIEDDAIDTALEMSPRYMRHLKLPDKAISWLDTASVRAEISRKFSVKSQDVISVIAKVARIPEDMVFRNVTDRFSNIRGSLAEHVIGQEGPIDAVARRLILNKGPLKDGFDRPDGVLLFLGPTGVGKTELAKSVARFLFGDEKKLIRIDMSEYQEGSVAVDKLIGMPRGIVGSERGGILTNQLKDNPYSVVLLDEVEKAGSSMLNIFLQAFDEGWLTDGRGKRVYLSDAIIIMTSNIGSRIFRKLASPLGFLSGNAGLDHIKGEIMKEVEKSFSPEFRNRIDDILVFSPLSMDEVGQIAKKYLSGIDATLIRHGKKLHVYDDAFQSLLRRGYSLQYGARFLKRTIDQHVKIPISEHWNYSDNFYLKLNGDELFIDIKSNGSAVQISLV